MLCRCFRSIKSCAATKRILFSTSTNRITLSPSCVKKLTEIGCEHGLLRIVVDSGGCSGFQYKFEVDKNISDEDLVLQQSGVKIVVDPHSMKFLENCEIGYEEELIRSGFKVTRNPQAEGGCSCGSSFSLKLD
ncbi:unnamed protein product [Mesocestoides corti]|uniref:Iron-sulfur cluster assembly 2 homolog, mitochondrial n=1 Tax=Mesocestoides corti TaxID=53468 RepID=A0A0R3UE03_MESCO|nr:unnamed protein product [Mesocestoides corti]